jgi:hypothetical protein
VQKRVHTCTGKMAKKEKLKSPEKKWASEGDEGGDKKNLLSDKGIQYPDGRDENFSAGVGRGLWR